MKVLGKQIYMIDVFNKEGVPTPKKFTIESKNGEDVSVRVDQVLNRHLEKLADNHMLVFKCQSMLNGKEVYYDLKFGLDSMEWMLFRLY